jgi:DNA-binding NarL/FixJ family response regulator
MHILIFAKVDLLSTGFQTILCALDSKSKIDLVADEAQLPSLLEKQEFDLIFIYPNQAFEKILTVMHLIKSMSPRSDLIVIVSEPSQVRTARDAGADRVIYKGFTAAQLALTIQDLKNKPPVFVPSV